MNSEAKIAVVGAGYAGLAAAVRLAQNGVPVTLYEAASTLGGRARRIAYQGETLDNGPHILLGAYTVMRELINLVAPSSDALVRMRLRIKIHEKLDFRGWPLPAPLNIVFGVLAAAGFSWGERWRMVQFLSRMRNVLPRADSSVDEWLAENAQTGALALLFWQPLCTAALNTLPAKASAQLFRNTLLAAFSVKASNSDLFFSRHDLSALFPEPAARYIAARGSEVRYSSRVRAIDKTATGYTVSTDKSRAYYSHVICAAAPRQAQHFIKFDELTQFNQFREQVTFEPIYTIYFKYASPPRLSFPMIGLCGGLTQWVFDRAALGFAGPEIACVISASGPHEALSRDAVLRTVAAELQQAFGLPAPTWRKLIIDKQATFAAVPGLNRPPQKTELANFFLAGDYTAGPYPATLEAAVASGDQCARHILNNL